MIQQLDPPIWTVIVGKGRGMAHFIIDYGIEHDIVWGVLMEETGEWWWASNWDVRGVPNWTLGAKRHERKA